MMQSPRSFVSRRLAALLVGGVVASLTGCGHPMQRKLEGRWYGDSVENFDERDIAAATGWVKSFSMEFSGSSVTVAIPTDDPRSGSYTIASAHDNDVVLAIKRKDGSVDKAKLRIDDDDNIRFMLADGRAIVMQRAN